MEYFFIFEVVAEDASMVVRALEFVAVFGSVIEAYFIWVYVVSVTLHEVDEIRGIERAVLWFGLIG